MGIVTQVLEQIGYVLYLLGLVLITLAVLGGIESPKLTVRVDGPRQALLGIVGLLALVLGTVPRLDGQVGGVSEPSTSETGGVDPTNGIPVGTILAWDPVVRSSGQDGDTGARRPIPEGWLICDGTNGTPSLGGRYVQGVEAVSAAGDTIGSVPRAANSITTAGPNGSTRRARTDDLGNGSSTFPDTRHTHSITVPSYRVVFLCRG